MTETVRTLEVGAFGRPGRRALRPAGAARLSGAADAGRPPCGLHGVGRRSAVYGILAHGFGRVRCDDCAAERLVAFSCKAAASAPPATPGG